MTKLSFSEALDKTKAIFYDLSAKRLNFIFAHRKERNHFSFVSKIDADTIKINWPDAFEIKLDTRREKYVECVINYED